MGDVTHPYRQHKIVILNPKGGSGKTTLSTNLASYYAIDGAAPVLVTDREHASLFADFAGERVFLDDEALEADGHPVASIGHLHTGVAPTDPAYVIYTSGSTGAPKGVCVPHRAIDAAPTGGLEAGMGSARVSHG